MVVHSNREELLGLLLPYNIVIEECSNLFWCKEFEIPSRQFAPACQLLFKIIICLLGTLVAYVAVIACNQHLHLICPPSADTAEFVGIIIVIFAHSACSLLLESHQSYHTPEPLLLSSSNRGQHPCESVLQTCLNARKLSHKVPASTLLSPLL